MAIIPATIPVTQQKQKKKIKKGTSTIDQKIVHLRICVAMPE
jgi:hypothetical protein